MPRTYKMTQHNNDYYLTVPAFALAETEGWMHGTGLVIRCSDETLTVSANGLDTTLRRSGGSLIFKLPDWAVMALGWSKSDTFRIKPDYAGGVMFSPDRDPAASRRSEFQLDLAAALGLCAPSVKGFMVWADGAWRRVDTRCRVLAEIERVQKTPAAK